MELIINHLSRVFISQITTIIQDLVISHSLENNIFRYFFNNFSLFWNNSC